MARRAVLWVAGGVTAAVLVFAAGGLLPGGIADSYDIAPDPMIRQGAELAELREYVEAHARARGALPESLGAAVEAAEPARAPRLRGLTWDAWGVPVRYAAAGGEFSLRSAGPDGAFGTTDDLVARGRLRSAR